MEKVYLAIPYSGMEESSFEQATKVSALLMQQGGINVFSPITNSHQLTKYGLKGDWEFWKDVDLQYLDFSDEVFVLIPEEGEKRVIDSVGVKAEVEYATQKGKPVSYIRYNKETECVSIGKDIYFD